jgi:asparagine synthase (glutamine-hydrolysing)
MHQISALSNIGERYAAATLFFRFTQRDKQNLLSKSLWDQVRDLNSADIIVDQYNRDNAVDPIDKMLYADIMTRLPEHSLVLTDRMTMAHSLEARSPFLDHTLVEFMASFPSNLKIRNRELKYVLRTLAEKYLPEKIVRRDKQGFMFPIAYWFQHNLHEFVRRMLMDSYFVKEGLFNRDFVLDLIEDHRANRVDNHVRLWMLLNLHFWYLLFIERLEIPEVEEQIRAYA